MAITTYSELQTAVTNRLGRTDLSSLIAEFISLGESRLNKKLRLFQMQEVATVSTAASSDTAALPTGFLELIDLRYSDFEDPLTQISLPALFDIKTDESAKPTHYSVSDTFVFNSPSDAIYSLRCAYYKKWDIETDSTNWLLTNAPKTYLAAALVEAFEYIRNGERQAFWEKAEMEAVKEVNNLDNRTRRNSRVTVDYSLQGPYTNRVVWPY